MNSLKPFSLSEYLKNKSKNKPQKVVTKDGKPVRIICTDAPDQEYPIVGFMGDSTETTTWTLGGKYCNNSTDFTGYDLMFEVLDEFKTSDNSSFSGVHFDYNNHTWGMCARDGGVDVLVDNKLHAHINYPNPASGESFEKDLAHIFNCHSIDAKLNMQDTILASMTNSILESIAKAYDKERSLDDIPCSTQDAVSLTPDPVIIDDTELHSLLEKDMDHYVALFNEGASTKELKRWIHGWIPQIVECIKKQLQPQIDKDLDEAYKSRDEVVFNEGRDKGREEALQDIPHWSVADEDKEFSRHVAILEDNRVVLDTQVSQGEYYIDLSELIKLPKSLLHIQH